MSYLLAWLVPRQQAAAEVSQSLHRQPAQAGQQLRLGLRERQAVGRDHDQLGVAAPRRAAQQRIVDGRRVCGQAGSGRGVGIRGASARALCNRACWVAGWREGAIAASRSLTLEDVKEVGPPRGVHKHGDCAGGKLGVLWPGRRDGGLAARGGTVRHAREAGGHGGTAPAHRRPTTNRPSTAPAAGAALAAPAGRAWAPERWRAACAAAPGGACGSGPAPGIAGRAAPPPLPGCRLRRRPHCCCCCCWVCARGIHTAVCTGGGGWVGEGGGGGGGGAGERATRCKATPQQRQAGTALTFDVSTFSSGRLPARRPSSCWYLRRWQG